MKNIIKYIFVFMIGSGTTLAILLSSIGPGSLDWEYKLPNGYEMRRINSNNIVIQHADDSENKDTIPSFIKEFSYDKRYVFSRNVNNISNNDIFDEVYYILDTEKNKVLGTFGSIEELKSQCVELGIELPLKWYRTSPDPNMNK